MIIRTDTRSIFTALFRQRWKFIFIFLLVVLAGLTYVRNATPGYQSTAKLLIKFGQDARPGISSQNNAADNSSADEHREMLQSNVTILTSRDLAENLLQNFTLEQAYPALVQDAPPGALQSLLAALADNVNDFIGNAPARGTLMDRAYKHYTDDLSVKTESDSDIITVGLYNQSPQTAQKMLQGLLDLFIARQSEIYANPQTGVLRERAAQEKAKLEDAQKRLYKYKQHAGTASIDEELTLLLKQRSDLTEEKGTKERIYSHYNNAASAAKDTDVNAIAGQVAELDRRIAGTVQRKAQNDDLTREIRLDEDNYAAAERSAEEADAMQSLNQQKITRVSVIEQPSLPYKPTRPWKSVIIVLCLLAGTALGLSVCILAENFDKSFTLPEQAAAELGLPLMASFAYARARRTRKP